MLMILVTVECLVIRCLELGENLLGFLKDQLSLNRDSSLRIHET